MSRKTANASFAAIAASMMVIILNADGSGANAEDVNPGMIEEPTEATAMADLTGEIVPEISTDKVAPTYISREVVQPLPERSEETAARSLGQLVSQTAVGEEMSEQMRCLATAVYFESRGEPLSGQLAVAQVIINRSESRSFPSTYCGVVHQPSQFSFVRKGAMPSVRASSKAWSNAKAIARIAHEGLWQSEAADSLYFHAKYVKPQWAGRKLARARINSHIFYR